MFDWCKFEHAFLESAFKNVTAHTLLEIQKLINQHDTFMKKEIKKELGQFYTPEALVKKTIQELHYKFKTLDDSDNLIDPACGTGIFLTESIEAIKKRGRITNIKNFVTKNVFGSDINPLAIVATKINILCVLIPSYSKNPSDLLDTSNEDNIVFPNIKWKNTITEPDNNSYTIIVGNPPYFKLTKSLIKNLHEYKKILYGQPNIYSFFMYWSINHLKVTGGLAFIVPQSIRSGLYFKKLRQHLNNLKIPSIVYINSRQNLFDRAEQAVLIICIENRPIRNSKTKIEFYDKSGHIISNFKICQYRIKNPQNQRLKFPH